MVYKQLSLTRQHKISKTKRQNLAVLSNEVLNNWLPSREKETLVTPWE